jgi:DNA-binding response OmpR family regulator
MPRILVIDDQADVRAMIGIVLRVNHFEIVEAASGAAGLKEFENSKFDVAIVDMFLQGTCGIDIIRTMRERVPDLPIVAISGITMLDFVSASPGLSDVICLQKPFRPNELVRAIEAARGLSRSAAGGTNVAEAVTLTALCPEQGGPIAGHTKNAPASGALNIAEAPAGLTTPSD